MSHCLKDWWKWKGQAKLKYYNILIAMNVGSPRIIVFFLMFKLEANGIGSSEGLIHTHTLMCIDNRNDQASIFK